MNATPSVVQLPPGLLPGSHAPLGATALPAGANFAVWSEHASAIELCIFDTDGTRELRRYPLDGPEDGVFHGLLPGFGAGLVYGFRVYGPYAPEQGQRCNPHKLLLDPYAREIVGRFHWDERHYGYRRGDPEGARSLDTRDNALLALKARVASPSAGQPHAGPLRSPDQIVLYELHVKGFSQQLPGIPDALRGTYSALAHPQAIAYFQKLGVTTLALLPVHYALSEAALVRQGLSNYWGYNTLGFFCPDPRLATQRDDPSAVNAEFRTMVETLHAAGLEVVLDVVFNHSAEGDELGPTLSFRGFDNASWYRLRHDDAGRYENFSGCGNTLNLAHPRVTQFVLDALRHWVREFGVDGFRFDLAPVLGRTRHGFDPDAAFFVALRQDPLLARVRLIAEPWDCGPDGYQLGRFPGRFMDWNDRFRDVVRSYWLGRPVTRGDFARRFCASSDLFHHGGRRPIASVNFVACHDGFTLADTLSYQHKHNHANGENNRDGRSDEISANFGTKGPSADPTVCETRRRLRHALLASLLLAQGTPMLCAGDEFGNSQSGNNNAYCQDNPLGWLDWAQADPQTQALVSQLLRLRREYPLLRHPHWLVNVAQDPRDASMRWLTPSGSTMQLADWHSNEQSAFAGELSAADPAVARLRLLFNPEPEPVRFLLGEGAWQVLLDSSGESSGVVHSSLAAPARSLLLLRCAQPSIEV